jgi:hypothetical protein
VLRAQRAMLHLLCLFNGLEVFEEVSPALRDVDREHVLEYCKRVLSKGDEACAVSDDDEAGQL